MQRVSATSDIISVLYVDDEQDLLDLAKAFMEENGDLKVTTCSDPLKALDAMSRQSFDVIVSDYQMPSMDGLEFLRHLRSDEDVTPFILFTGKGREDIVIEAFDCGADFYVQKGGDAKTQFAELSGKIRYAFMRRQAERTVEMQIEAMEASIDGMALVDKDQKHVYVNGSYLKIFGFDDPGEIIGRDWRVLYDANEVTRFEEEISSSFGQKRHYIGIGTGRRKDGSHFPLELTITLLKDDGTIAVVRDLTQFQKMERERDNYASNIRTLFDSINEMVFIMDEDCNILDCNGTASQKLGYSHEDLQGKNLIDLHDPSRRDDAQRILDSILEGGDEVCDVPMVTKDGSEVLTETNVSRGIWNDFSVLIGVSRDTQYRTRLENALRMANRKLNLLSGITRHDILNQLTVLQGYLDIAMNKEGDDPLEELKKVEDSARLIQKDIEFTRQYEKLGSDDPSWHNIASLIKEIEHSKAEGIEITDDTGGLSVLADPMFGKVFYNMMDNTINHGEGATRVHVYYDIAGDDCRLIWEDNGQGVLPEMKSGLFQRGVGRNHGFGLFFTEKILLITDITIKEEGEPGKGAKFVMTVPKGAWRVKPKPVSDGS